MLFGRVEIDAEKGNGPALVSKYNVGGYPNVLFLDSEGNILSNSSGDFRLDGYLDPENFAHNMKIVVANFY